MQHARTREQFGRPAGTHRAVARPCAGTPVRAETTRAAVHAASATAPRRAEVRASPGRRTLLRTSEAPGRGPDVPDVTRRVTSCSPSNRSSQAPDPPPSAMSRIAPRECHGSWHSGITER
ncbi:acyl-CoA dehydrogenase family protein [Streptomyces sp. NPDC085927]|uniref:acyl-CoA dehydrogenase family protein n=1 Tax=Streptomyces sp. NPDC085927 TaxID=3365738 RepID=UPI0037D418E3